MYIFILEGLVLTMAPSRMQMTPFTCQDLLIPMRQTRMPMYSWGQHLKVLEMLSL